MENQLNFLENIVRKMSGEKTLPGVIDVLLDGFEKLLAYDGAAIAFHDKKITYLDKWRGKKLIINKRVKHYVDEHIDMYGIWLQSNWNKNGMKPIIWDDSREQTDVWFDVGSFRTFCWFPIIFHNNIIGSFSFIWEKPFCFDRSCVQICSIVGYVIAGEIQRLRDSLQEIQEREQRITVLEEELQGQLSFKKHIRGVIGNDPGMKAIYETIKTIANFDVNVLIEGETGTGKELIANDIHFSSQRNKGPFIKVNCGALSETLLASELFGHKKGSFTGAYRDTVGRFELANNGTLFLDEIGEMTPSMQVKILRVLQQRTFEMVGDSKSIETNARIICATNKKLVDAIARNEFREDLYYRLKVINIVVPPLRKRISDIPLFLEYFIEKFNKLYGTNVKGFSKNVLEKFFTHLWPGNVRELENVVERFIITNKTGIVDDVEIDGSTPNNFQLDLSWPLIDFHTAKKNHIAEFEKKYIHNLLKKNNGSIKKSSKEAGINRKNLYLKIKQYKIHRLISN